MVKIRIALAFTLIAAASLAASGSPRSYGPATARSQIDSLLCSIKALEEGDAGRAIELSGERFSNSWLEIYRSATRAGAFLASGDTAGAASESDYGLELVESYGEPLHPAAPVLADMAVSCGRYEKAEALFEAAQTGILSPRSLLSLSLHGFETGDTVKAATFIESVSRVKADRESMFLLRSLADRGFLESGAVTVNNVARLAGAAVSAGDEETAGALIDAIRSFGAVSEWRADILNADMLAKKGRHSGALACYKKIWSSESAPEEGRKAALLRIAAIQYDMRRFGDSSESYKSFGLSFPDDEMAEESLDRSARIDIARGRTDEAVETWGRIAEFGPSTHSGLEALLGLAAALERMERRAEAFGILEKNLARTDGTLRQAYLYWLIRTSGENKDGARYRIMLKEAASRSFYAAAIETGDGFLTHHRDDISGIIVEEAERTYREGIISHLRPAGLDSLFEHPSLEAFRLFAEAGSRSMAADCARGYLARADAAGADGRVITGVYAVARSYGMEDFCLEIAVSGRMKVYGNGALGIMTYPIAYGIEIDSSAGAERLQPALILAVIREESHFKENALSPAGAAGLMQLMPSTGEWISRKIGYKQYTEELLFDPLFNIKAGCWYLKFLMDRGDGSIVGALAAYNAGHGRMKSWRRMFDPGKDPISALELIGPSETRRYVRRVLDSLIRYQRLMPASKPTD